MKIFINISICFALLFAVHPLAAQLVKTPTLPSTITEDTPSQEDIAKEAPQHTRSALSVSRLPDIKLNENIISKTVFDYQIAAPLIPAAKFFSEGQTQKTLDIYTQALSGPNPQTAAQAVSNLAILNLQNADYKQALKNIDIAVKIDNVSPTYQLIKIWILSAMGDTKKAQKEYESLLFITADFEYISAAKFILAQALFLKKDYNAAMNTMQNLYGTDPYTISHAVYIMGRINYETGAYNMALTLFEQALTHDANNYMAQKYLAMTYEKLRNYIPAWQSYASIFVLDTKDKFLSKKVNKLKKHLHGPMENYLYYTRLSEIYTKNTQPINSPTLRIALYARADGRPTPLKSFTFMPSAGFTIVDEKLGNVTTGEAYTPKTILWNAEHKGIHIQNKWDNVEFSTKRLFIIKLDKAAAMQVKDAQAANIFDTDLGDKELSGTLLVIPSDEGIMLINNTQLSDVLPAMLTYITRDVKSPAVLEALSIALRTRFTKEILNTQNALYDMPDMSPAMRFGGINMQSPFVKKAVMATAGKVLTEPKTTITDNAPVVDFELAIPDIYRACGPVTEDGLRNTQTAPNYQFSPLNLFKYMLANPPKDLYSTPQDPTLWSAIKWAYSIPVKEVQGRLDNYHNIGKLKSVYISQYTPTGRAQRIVFSGSKKNVDLSFDEANFILAANTLRSNFLFITPLSKGGKVVEYLVMGTDTGKGRGLCINAADGLSRAGKTTDEILQYYYPNLKVADKWQIQKLPL